MLLLCRSLETLNNGFAFLSLSSRSLSSIESIIGLERESIEVIISRLVSDWTGGHLRALKANILSFH